MLNDCKNKARVAQAKCEQNDAEVLTTQPEI